jgi:RNA-directed DNA polymerase
MSQKTNHPQEKVRQLQHKLYIQAKKCPTRRFHALYERIYDWEVLKESWKRVRQKQGSAGVDEITIKEIEGQGIEPFLKGIQTYLKEGRYHPSPVKRIHIPKPDGTKRPLGIPTIRDRVIQMAAKIVIEPVFEADFKPDSYGFRPKRSPVDALERIRELSNKGYNHILDADIQKCFDRIDHDKLMACLEQRLSDRKVLKLIRKWLKAGILEAGEVNENFIGTPQGGVISPLLANILLHEMDKSWEQKHSTLGVLVRYCDDFVVMTKTRYSVQEAKQKVEALLEALSLELHPDKTKLVDLSWGKQGFEFLGHTLKKVYSGKFHGKFFLNRWPSPKSMTNLYRKIKAITHYRGPVRSIQAMIPSLNRLLQGWSNYFRSGNAARKFAQVERYLWQRLILFINRRRKYPRPHRHGTRGYEWYRSLGIYSLIGIIRYPKMSTSYA